MAVAGSTPHHRYPDQFQGENFDGTEPDPGGEDVQALTAWKEKNRLAESHILTAVHDAYVHPILDTGMSKETWDILISNYAAKSQQNTLFYIEEWINTSWDKSTDIEEHISHHNMLYRKFKEAGGNFSKDAIKSHLLLMSLPSDFRSLVDAFYAKGGNMKKSSQQSD